MDNFLQDHGAKHVYRVPEGLGELCSDISREVLRTQPRDIYRYIADYVDALLITRENAKVAVRVVKNILLGSEAIVGILHRTGLNLAQIAIAAPRLQKTFRAYLDSVDIQPVQPCEDNIYEEKSRASIRNILQATGSSLEKAERAATMIQSTFRGHYERMVEREAKGEIQWERAASNTIKILKNAGVSQPEATNAATLIQTAYRGYYTRRSIKMECEYKEANPPERDLPGSRQTIQAVAWLDMIYEDSGLTAKRANEAATLIQKVYRGYRTRRHCHDVERTSSANSFVVDAIVENVRQRIFERVLSRQDIPQEFGSQRQFELVPGKIDNAYKERLRESRLSSETDTDRIHDDENSESDDQREISNNNEIHLSTDVLDDDDVTISISIAETAELHHEMLRSEKIGQEEY